MAISCKNFYENYVPTRIVTDGKRDAAYAGKCYFAECESGWDFNPRFQGYCVDFNPVDLNANLYFYEKLFAEYGHLSLWTLLHHCLYIIYVSCFVLLR